MIPTLHSSGFLILGPTKYRFVRDKALLDDICVALIVEENASNPKLPVIRDDLRVRELFDKSWCGMLDLSEEGVSALDDWDTAFAKLQAKKAAAGAVATT